MRTCANCLFQTKTYLTAFSFVFFFFFPKLDCPPGINKVVWSLFSVWNCLVAGRGRWPDSQQIAWQTDQDNVEQQLKTMRRHRCPSRKWRFRKFWLWSNKHIKTWTEHYWKLFCSVLLLAAGTGGKPCEIVFHSNSCMALAKITFWCFKIKLKRKKNEFYQRYCKLTMSQFILKDYIKPNIKDVSVKIKSFYWILTVA